jgi:hypothetical protein
MTGIRNQNNIVRKLQVNNSTTRKKLYTPIMLTFQCIVEDIVDRKIEEERGNGASLPYSAGDDEGG